MYDQSEGLKINNIFLNFHNNSHLPSIIEIIPDNISRFQVTQQTVFNRQVGVEQTDHGLFADSALTVERQVDFLQNLQGPESHTHITNIYLLLFKYLLVNLTFAVIYKCIWKKLTYTHISV